MKKTLIFFLLCGISLLSANGQSEIEYSHEENGASRMLKRMSDNQKYAVGTDSYKTAFIWDLETGEVRTYPSADMELNLKAEDISDNGIVAGMHLEKPAMLIDGVWEELPLPEGALSAYPQSITRDGSKIAGSASYSGYMSKPVIWENGECRILDYPAKVNGFGDVVQAKIKDMSGDGTILVGNLFDRMSIQMACVWRAPLYECEVFSVEACGSTYMNCFAARISNNGEWVTGPITAKQGNQTYSYRYNIKEDVFEIIFDLQTPYGGSCIDNDGTIFTYTSPSGMPGMIGRTAYIQRPGEKSQNLFEHMLADFEIDMNLMSKSCTVMDVADNENLFAGFGMDETGRISGFLVRNNIANSIVQLEPKNEPLILIDNILTVSAQNPDIRIYSATGKLVRKTSQTSVDLNNLQAGIYVVTVMQEGKITCKKIVIQ